MDAFQHKLPLSKIRELLGKDDPWIVEIGCNDGDDSQQFLINFERARLHCFECDPRPIAQFKEKITDLRCELHECALGAEDGEVRFWQSGGTTKGAHKQDWDLSGSICKPTGHLKQSKWCTFDTQITVPLRRLDTFWKSWGEPIIDLIWLDVQGAESKVFAGGRQTLTRTRYLYTEYGHWREPLYEGQMNLPQTIEALGPDWEPLSSWEGYNLLARNKNFQV